MGLESPDEDKVVTAQGMKSTLLLKGIEEQTTESTTVG